MIVERGGAKVVEKREERVGLPLTLFVDHIYFSIPLGMCTSIVCIYLLESEVQLQYIASVVRNVSKLYT